MPRKPTGRPNGRTKISIDWDLVDKMLESHCTGVEIASRFGCSDITFYARVLKEKGMSLQEYSALKKASGDASLKVKQMQLALSGQGNLGMLIWLGKNRLGQKDNPYQAQVFDGKLAEILDGLKTVRAASNFFNETAEKAQISTETQNPEDIGGNI